MTNNFKGRGTIALTRKRILTVSIAFILFLAYLFTNLFKLQILSNEYYKDKVYDQITTSSSLKAERGNIYDSDMNLLATNGLLPDATIYVDVRPEVGLTRIKSNKREQNRLDLEKASFHQKVYEGYKQVSLMFENRFKTINGEQTPDEVFIDTIKVLDNIIESEK